ncbi:hypothetical protein MZM54_01970 [[Brevibacterium] frigoritolerans]|nr:hypothetical protein [Peribacillus frigoritolerans]
MISFILLLLLIIPFVVKWKASEFLFSEKVYGLFLIWFSRILTSFLLISAFYYWIGDNAYYLSVGFVIYYTYSIYQERRLYFVNKKTTALI